MVSPDPFEEQLKKYAIYHADKSLIKKAPIEQMIHSSNLKEMSRGLQARVYHEKKSDWVIKEGRWDLDFDLSKEMKISVPAQLAENILGIFDYTFLPTKDEVIRQYTDYMIFLHYFGYFANEQDYYHPQLGEIINKQKDIRSRLIQSLDEISDHYSLQIRSDIADLLDGELLTHNFLPKEYLLYGQSISDANKGKDTSYIFQKFVRGKNLHDFKKGEWGDDTRSQILLLTLLILYLNFEQSMVPDTRPRYFLFESDDWLANTDNIIVSEEGLKFIDTRWMWNRKSNIIKRGVIIPELIIKHSRNYFIQLTKDQ